MINTLLMQLWRLTASLIREVAFDSFRVNATAAPLAQCGMALTTPCNCKEEKR